jgi:hypothetical protein
MKIFGLHCPISQEVTTQTRKRYKSQRQLTIELHVLDSLATKIKRVYDDDCNVLSTSDDDQNFD